jgi:formylglycine-generating enzyme required for sulfatase activity
VSFAPQFVRIPGGSYVMGDAYNYVDPGHPTDELPLHNVTIAPFYMSTTLMTCREYCDYLNTAYTNGLVEVRSGYVYGVGGTNIYSDTTAAYPHSTITWTNNTFYVRSGRDLHPITGIRWFGAIAYCNWLSARDGYDASYDVSTGDCDMSKNGYRLPTEAEWEFAGRGGQTNPYYIFPWGNDTNIDGTLANWEGSGDPWEAAEYPRTTPVGFYNGALRYKTDYGWPATNATYQTRDGSNAYGLYDMSGNAWELVNDWYKTDYYTNCVTGNIVNNPPGPTTGSTMPNGAPCRAMRGGNWWNGGGQTYFGHARVANRNPSYYRGPDPYTGLNDPDGPWFHIGFRVMRPDKAGTTVGLMLNTTNAWPGYTLMSPMHSTNTYLINNAGQYVHKWTSTYQPGRADYLLENGHLMRACMVMQGGPSTGGGEGGRIEEYDWEGNLVWAIDYISSNYIHHHDFRVLPNGNVLLLVAEKKTYAEVIAAGFNPALLDSSISTQGYMLPDCLVEVKPTKPYGGTVVWEWHLWDHMIQDFDNTKNNYGVVADHPELIDVNGPGIKIPQFWNHVNGIDYNTQLDQIMISNRGSSELFVIDHGTTTAQAASHAGGRYDKGGDILYRWGYAQQYDRSAGSPRALYQQHHTHWIETNCPGAGNIMIFNNGIGRNYSSVDEIVPPVDAAGNYSIVSGQAFGPSSLAWTWTNSPATNFYSSEISGAYRLPNGNTIVCGGIFGDLFEVTTAGQMVWRYICPETTTILSQGSTVPSDPARPDQLMNAVFRVNRYATNYVGLLGKDLTPRGTIETYTGASTDTDGDGLPDVWERQHFGSLYVAGANTDYDRDGLTDLMEYALGLNPTKADTDGDGIPDAWEILYGLDPSYAGDASYKAPNGSTYLETYLAGLNPSNPASQLRITDISLIGNDVRITWIGGTNAWQLLQCRTNFVNTNAPWINLYTNPPPTAVTNQFIHQGGASRTSFFYRIKAWR